MKTSWNNIRIIEDYLRGKLSTGDRLVFEAKLLLNPSLRKDLYFQKKAHLMVKMYHRKKVKQDLEALHHRIFTDKGKLAFQQRIFHLFNSENL